MIPASSSTFISAARATYPSKVSTATVYRRLEQADSWHHRSDCPDWPTDGFRVTSTPPEGGLFCTHCDRLRQLEFGSGGKAA